MTEESLFAAALDRSSSDRILFLQEACGDDVDLLRRMQALLAAHEKAIGILERPAGPTGARGATLGYTTAEAPEGERTGAVIADRYKLLEQIGEGGMGTVWVAEQTQPVRRKVALKLIRPGMDSKTVLSRFDAERQALALMDHPNIAKVLDGGTTETGRPFFVMEYVKGVPITEYSDNARLSIAQRLELFVPVCQAVQHAHLKGIIHRDLKPSNILVCLYDGQPVPKVIDFGLAKATQQPLTDRTLHTAHGMMLGTPLYMSPEQAEFNNLDVDMRTDVYALGVILYELLTGTTPLESQRFKEAAWHEMLRLIKEEEPPPPSIRLSGSGSLQSLAAQRQMEPVRLPKLVRGELDWIVMKCLEKDRARRYETAHGLARDVQRYLSGDSVEACPPSLAYRLRKFALRNRPVLTMAAMLAFLMLAGLIVMSWQAMRALRAEEVARHAASLAAAQREKAVVAENTARVQRDLAVAEKQRGDDEATITHAINEFLLSDLLGQADTGNQLADGSTSRNPNITVLELLDRASESVARRFASQPLTEAAIRLTLGETYLSLGRLANAQDHLERSVQLRADLLGPAHADTLTSRNALAFLYLEQGQSARGEALSEDVLVARLATLGPDHLDTLTSKVTRALAYILKPPPEFRPEDRERAAALLKEAVHGRGAALGPEHPLTLEAKFRLAGVLPPSQAEPLLREVVDARMNRLGADHPTTIFTKLSLAEACQAVGKRDEAERLFKDLIATSTAKLAPGHPLALSCLFGLSLLYLSERRPDLAEPIIRDGVAASRYQPEVPHPLKRWFLRRQLEIASRKGDQVQVELLLQELADSWRRATGADSREYASVRDELGELYLKQGRSADAETLLRAALTIREQKEPDAWTTFHTKSLLGGALALQKHYDGAEPLLIAGYEGMKQRENKIPAQSKPQLSESSERIVQLYESWGKPDKADEWKKKRSLLKDSP